MPMFSRRALLLSTVSVAALSAAVVVTSTGYGLTAPEFFVDTKGKKEISFTMARKIFGSMLDREIASMQKDYNIRPSEADIRRIHERVWDKAHIAISEFYAPSEKFP